RYTLPPPEKTQVHTFAISPDGKRLAIAAMAEKRNLYLRSLDSLAIQMLPGTENATYPFWSPDSRYIGFFADGKLKKVAATGGPPQTLCDAADGRGGSWNRDGVILFSPALDASLNKVPAVGGVPSVVVEKLPNGNIRYPVFLPDGRQFLYLVNAAADDQNGVWAGALDSKGGRRLLSDLSSVSFAASTLLFARESTLMAQPFDASRAQLNGEIYPVAEHVSFGANTHLAPVSVSDDGVLVYQTGRNVGASHLTWYERGGKLLHTTPSSGSVFGFKLSPDGKRLASSRFISVGGRTSDIWIHELARGGTETRFTFHPSRQYSPVWSPDGSRVVFSSDRRGGRLNLFQKDSNGVGQDQPLPDSPNFQVATDWSADGRWLVYSETTPKTKSDIWLLPMTGEKKPVVFLQTEFNELQGQLSADGRWMAYASDESGQYEVYVRPFPSGAGKWRISTGGGAQPRWRRDGKELFYLAADRRLMAVPVKSGFEAGLPEPLFTVLAPPGSSLQVAFLYDVAADGKRFLVSGVPGETTESPLTVVVNWNKR
ncbi:MAG: hypothetical protein ACRD96_11040, partial [Bryobacteraceae bacterium]